MTNQELVAQLEALKLENAKLKAKPVKGLSLRVSQKGALSIYGMGRFPVTLYKSQWTRLLAQAADIEQFIKDNDADLKVKDAA